MQQHKPLRKWFKTNLSLSRFLVHSEHEQYIPHFFCM